MDEGWTRWLLEQYAFSFTNIRSADVHAEELRSRYDVVVLPSERVGSLLSGYAKGTVPSRYEGGLGEEGIRSLDAFVRAGGTLVCMGASSDLCIDEPGGPACVRSCAQGALQRVDLNQDDVSLGWERR